jgi:hypothetical protein
MYVVMLVENTVLSLVTPNVAVSDSGTPKPSSVTLDSWLYCKIRVTVCYQHVIR